MISETNVELVLIKPDSIQDKSEGGIFFSEDARDNLKRKQNRGTVVSVGRKVELWQPGDYVSFYRAAATSVMEDGEEFLTIHTDHILVRFKKDTNVKK